MTALFALATSLLWGLADFGGGLLTRRIPALTVVVVSQAVAAAVLGAIVVATGGWGEAGPRLWFALTAGLVGPVALISFYQALSLGPMGVVSPLATLSVAVPVGVGLVLGCCRPPGSPSPSSESCSRAVPSSGAHRCSAVRCCSR